MTFDRIIRGGLVVSGTDSSVADVGIVGSEIAAVGDLFGAAAFETIDARGLWVFPGGIDTQVHFREPGLEQKEDIESGTRAALYGGISSVLEMPNTVPPTTDPERLAEKVGLANSRAWCNIGFFVGASPQNAESLADWETLPGTPGIKIFMGSSTGSLLVASDEDLTKVLRSGKRRCAVHAEDEVRNREMKEQFGPHPSVLDHPNIRDAESARLATERLIRLSSETGRPVHILHISTADEIPLIVDAKKRGYGTTAEVTPQHLWFAAPACYQQLGSLAQMNPPIRDEPHRAALWQALEDGVFDVFGSDHAPHTLEEKFRPYPSSPSGMPGVQTLLPVLLTFVSRGWLSKETLVRMLCERPAELYGILRKGRIEPGYDADLVLIDPGRKRTVERGMLQSKCGWSPYEGEELTGWPEAVVIGGQVAIRNAESLKEPLGQVLEFGSGT